VEHGLDRGRRHVLRREDEQHRRRESPHRRASRNSGMIQPRR
jgi:hypothetical protein